MPRIAISPVTTSASDQSGTAARIACLQPLDALLCLAHRQQHLLEGDALLKMLELLARKPAHVRPGPRLLARIVQALPQQERRDLLALSPQILHRRSARPRQVTHRLVTLLGNPYGGQLAGAQQLDQAKRVAPVGLHPIARLLRNERRRNHNAMVTEALDLPVEPVSGRPRLVAERQPLVLGGKLPHKLRRRRDGVVDLAEKPNLARPPGLRDRNRIAQLGTIKSHESFAMIAHDSPSLLEALPGLSG